MSPDETRDHEDEVEPSEEQWAQDETEDELKEDMETGEKDEDVYSEEGREGLLEDDELSYEEDAFMEGAEGRGQLGKCDECHKVLDDDPDSVVEREFDGEMHLFCSDECAEKYARKKE
ncbi:hypothetical protein KY328_00650 [Candidatus Woesearchaeota archaeon]|nr:hypothetical protein [Candidatus Woesearchaeota archaeon]MBW3021406.1 hypothetical protein [Candidatus Woesearchaeota archaeon]